ncbi:hypothetical protein HS088_TW04G01531 [Tripterygium wilfordii]|uniref:Uncharacterized protein n=1 Tax=Tripterygium wilfordii TaxID=458696 RepID=A0A7J7DT59_TRIWF|nr:hypothetical protein HS088_TW04G01531 [Tripterygium wilfordii]
MATGAASDGLLRYFYEGCISSGDTGIQRRPYHRNCEFANLDNYESCKGMIASYQIRCSKTKFLHIKVASVS